MQCSSNATSLIRVYEGFSLKPYQDSAGYYTVGIGHKIGPLEPVCEITRDTAEQLFAEDIQRTEDEINPILFGITLTQGQYDALLSFAFNVGAEALAKSTLLVKLKAGDYQGAADELLRWSHSGGKEVSGLYTRRQAERSLFLYVPTANAS